MASTGKTPKTPKTPKAQWQAVQHVIGKLVHLASSDAPKLIRQLQDVPSLQQGIKIGWDILTDGAFRPTPEIPTGRPVTTVSVPTAHRARKLAYAPDLNGRADPGEIVWTWVAYEDDPTRGKDRPVLVVGRDRRTLLGLMLSSRHHHRDDRNWIGIGAGGWDDADRPSWVRLDRILDVPEEGIRREGAILARPAFDVVAARLRADYSWS